MRRASTRRWSSVAREAARASRVAWRSAWASSRRIRRTLRERIVVVMDWPPGEESCRGVWARTTGRAWLPRSVRPSPVDTRPLGGGSVDPVSTPRGTSSNRQSCHGGLVGALPTFRAFLFGLMASRPRPVRRCRLPPRSDSVGHPPAVATRAGSRGALEWPRRWRSPRRAGEDVLRARCAHDARAGHARRLRLCLSLFSVFLCSLSLSSRG